MRIAKGAAAAEGNFSNVTSKAVWAWVFGAVIGTSLASAASTAAAQARQAVSISGAPAAITLSTSARPVEDDRSSSRDRTPMGRASIGLNVGMAGSGVGKYELKVKDVSVPGEVDSRSGLYLALPIHVGGDGFGWTFSPYLSRSSITHKLKDSEGYEVGSEDTSLSAYGLYTGPVMNFQVAQPLYLGIGAGIKLAYILNETYDYAADAYGRVPLSATYYITDQLAIVAETGIGYGVSAFIDKSVTNPNVVGVNQKAIESGSYSLDDVRTTDEEPKFGKAFAWDFSIGVRLP